jgi:hypothetical protein
LPNLAKLAAAAGAVIVADLEVVAAGVTAADMVEATAGAEVVAAAIDTKPIHI